MNQERIFCPSCGDENLLRANFCQMCATALPTREAAVTTAPAEPVNVWEMGKSTRKSQKVDRSWSARPQSEKAGGGFRTGEIILSNIGIRSAARTYAILGGIGCVFLLLGAAAAWSLKKEAHGTAAPEDPYVLGVPVPEDRPGHELEVPDEVVRGADPSLDVRKQKRPAMDDGGDPSESGGGKVEDTPPRPVSKDLVAKRKNSTTKAKLAGASTSLNDGKEGATAATSKAIASGSASDAPDSNSSRGMSAAEFVNAYGGGSSEGTGGGSIVLNYYGSEVRNAVRRWYVGRVQSCFDNATKNEPNLSGTVVIGMTIGGNGQVQATEIRRNSTGNEGLGNCLKAQIKTWKLPAPPEGQPLIMSMPFSR